MDSKHASSPMLSIAREPWDSTTKHKFVIQQLGPIFKQQRVECVVPGCITKTDLLVACKIRYDSETEIDIPAGVLRNMHDIRKTSDFALESFAIPVDWNFLVKCEIELEFKLAVACTLYYVPVSEYAVVGFQKSAIFLLQKEQVVEIQCNLRDGQPVKSPIFMDCQNRKIDIYDTESGKWLPGGCLRSEIAQDDFESRRFFIRAHQECAKPGTFQVFWQAGYDLKVHIETTRVVELVFEADRTGKSEKHWSALAKLEYLNVSDPLPEWQGQVVVYRGKDRFAMMERARSITHLLVPKMMTGIEKPQAACVLGVSVGDLEDRMLEAFAGLPNDCMYALLTCEKK
jgi:hypothetical protein